VVFWHSSTLAAVMPQRFSASGLRFVTPPLTNLRALCASGASQADLAHRGRWFCFGWMKNPQGAAWCG
jgi:hypothetical protein